MFKNFNRSDWIAFVGVIITAVGVTFAGTQAFRTDKSSQPPSSTDHSIDNNPRKLNGDLQQQQPGPNAGPAISDDAGDKIKNVPIESPEQGVQSLPILAGEWEGVFTIRQTTFRYELSLEQIGNRIFGSSNMELVVDGKRDYAVMKINDGILSNNKLTFTEEKTDWSPLLNSDWCEKKVSLRWERRHNAQTLTGSWIDPACNESGNFEDVSGSITLTRKE